MKLRKIKRLINRIIKNLIFIIIHNLLYDNSNKNNKIKMEYLLQITVEKLEGDEGYIARSNDFPDLFAHGKNISEKIKNAKDVVNALVEDYIEEGDPLPFHAIKQKKLDTNVILDIPITGKSIPIPTPA